MLFCATGARAPITLYDMSECAVYYEDDDNKVTHQCEIFIILSNLLFDCLIGCGYDVRVCFGFGFGFDLLLERFL
jgi:hypothetical protein